MNKIRISPRKDNDFDEFSDFLDKVSIATIGHYTEFGFIDNGIKCMTPETNRFYGKAVTVRIPAQESKALHIAVSMAEEGDVLVIDRCGDKTHACFGEMVALCAKVRKLAGVVIDGPITDYEEILKMGIPVFARGISALTTKFIKDCGEINYDISCGGVVVHPGDLIVADINGVLVLRPFETANLLQKAFEDQNVELDEIDHPLELGSREHPREVRALRGNACRVHRYAIM